MTALPGKVVVRDQVDPVRWTVEEGRILLRAEDTGGLFSFFELTTPPAGGPPVHLHQGIDETFYVIEGAYEIQLGDRIHEAGPGTLLYGPRGIGHGFRNISDRPSRMLCISTPGGAETLFEGLAEILGHDGPPDRAAVAALVARHDIQYLGRPGEPLDGRRAHQP
ncbi:cupin domain-containing protein [Kitasatospora sp. NPDC058965]|uniref:cupin domain-containing protein n=1 Tax=Kitasatospora sp. NPDC058965 TaxID=3346682 RepID=UPI0036AF59BA